MAGRQRGYEFSRKGQKRIGTADLWIVTYAEVQRPTQVTAPAGAPVPMRGEFYIDPATGHVVRTVMRTDGRDESAYADRPGSFVWVPRIQIDVTYRLDPKLKAWVPVEMKELYERRIEVLTLYRDVLQLPPVRDRCPDTAAEVGRRRPAPCDCPAAAKQGTL